MRNTMFPTNMDDINKRGSRNNCSNLTEPGYCLDLRLFNSLYPMEKNAISAPEFMNNISREINKKIASTIITPKIQKSVVATFIGAQSHQDIG